MPSRSDPADDESLKRLGGGRWQTRDERFTIEPQSGTWAVVDAEQTDDLGMPLVRGPFPSLTAAKAAIADARSSEPATSPLAGRLEQRREAKGETGSTTGTERSSAPSKATSKEPERAAPRARAGGPEPAPA